MHPTPPIDAEQPVHDRQTVFNPETTEVPHPSSYDILSIFDNDASLNDLYSQSLSTQFRHIHQRYCDRNHTKRQVACDHVEQDHVRCSQNITRPENIPIDCRFSFPKPLQTKSHVKIEECRSQHDGLHCYKVFMVSKRNDSWLNSSMHVMTEIWGANMDWQLILDSGMVIEYMTKYVTKSDFSISSSCNRFMKRLYTQTVESEGRSVHTFLCRAMSKMLGERTMSKQEKCHLVLGSPIVHSTHKMINVDLDNNSSVLSFPSKNTETSSSLVRKDSLIDAYATRFSSTK